MTKEVLISIIAASASICAALVGVFSAFISSREQRKTFAASENLKQEISRKNSRDDLRRQALKERLDILKKSVSALQSARDLIQDIVGPHSKYTDLIQASKEFSAKEQEISTYYQLMYAIDDGNHVRELHSAKNMLHMTSQMLNKLASNSTRANEIPSIQIAKLQDVRERIKSIQLVMRDSHLSTLEEYLS